MPIPIRPTSTETSDRLFNVIAKFVDALALASYLLVMVLLVTPFRLGDDAGWPMALLVLLATTATLISLTRQLPGQNVLLAAFVIAVIGGVTHGLSAATGIPFGSLIFTDAAGPQLFNKLAWPFPFIWIVAVLNSRGVARLILRPWRKLRVYGFWLIGLTVVLAVIFDTALEPFASRVNRCWLWEQTTIPVSWHGEPITNFLGWAVVTLLILAFVTPALINKNPSGKRNPPDYHPLIVWISLDLLFAVGAAGGRLWSAVIFCGIAGIIVSVAAIRGGRW